MAISGFCPNIQDLGNDVYSVFSQAYLERYSPLDPAVKNNILEGKVKGLAYEAGTLSIHSKDALDNICSRLCIAKEFKMSNNNYDDIVTRAFSLVCSLQNLELGKSNSTLPTPPQPEPTHRFSKFLFIGGMVTTSAGLYTLNPLATIIGLITMLVSRIFACCAKKNDHYERTTPIADLELSVCNAIKAIRTYNMYDNNPSDLQVKDELVRKNFVDKWNARFNRDLTQSPSDPNRWVTQSTPLPPPSAPPSYEEATGQGEGASAADGTTFPPQEKV